MREKIKEILEQIETVIVGKNDVMERILMAILAGGHVLMEDVPGVGKTTTAMTFARVLGLETRRVQFTSDTMPSDIIGFSVYDKASGKLVYKPGAVMTNLLLADEINRTSSKTQSALLEAMEEGHVSIDGQTHPLPTPLHCAGHAEPGGLRGHTAAAEFAAGPLSGKADDRLSGSSQSGEYSGGAAYGKSIGPRPRGRLRGEAEKP